MLIIGDVHEKVFSYLRILRKHKGPSIQVGDFGLTEAHQWHLEKIVSSVHKINFGNHDDTTFLDHKHSCGDSSFNSKLSLMTLRGANSIDKWKRFENIDWWTNEELNYDEMTKAMVMYERCLPKIMITHTCPYTVREELFGIPNTPENKSITTDGLQAMFELHQPELWIFGHHHKSKNEVINGTRFICLAELETFIM